MHELFTEADFEDDSHFTAETLFDERRESIRRRKKNAAIKKSKKNAKR